LQKQAYLSNSAFASFLPSFNVPGYQHLHQLSFVAVGWATGTASAPLNDPASKKLAATKDLT